MRESANSRLSKGLSRAAIAILAIGIAAAPAFAQSGGWTVDSNHSDARIAIDGKINGSSQSITLGAGGVSGTLRLDRSDLTKSTLQFTIDPAGSGPAAVGPNGETPDAGSLPATLLSFRSEKASRSADGKLHMTGALTVTRMEREALLDANEAYSGPVYVSRVVTHTQREQSFIFAVPASDPADGGSAKIKLEALVKINREDFPELVNAALSTNWPFTVQDETCEASPNSREDYSGTLCTGSAVTLPSITRTAASAGEDYPGTDANSAEPGNLVTLALHLQLTPENAQLSSKIGQ